LRPLPYILVYLPRNSLRAFRSPTLHIASDVSFQGSPALLLCQNYMLPHTPLRPACPPPLITIFVFFFSFLWFGLGTIPFQPFLYFFHDCVVCPSLFHLCPLLPVAWFPLDRGYILRSFPPVSVGLLVDAPPSRSYSRCSCPFFLHRSPRILLSILRIPAGRFLPHVFPVLTSFPPPSTIYSLPPLTFLQQMPVTFAGFTFLSPSRRADLETSNFPSPRTSSMFPASPSHFHYFWITPLTPELYIPHALPPPFKRHGPFLFSPPLPTLFLRLIPPSLESYAFAACHRYLSTRHFLATFDALLISSSTLPGTLRDHLSPPISQ